MNPLTLSFQLMYHLLLERLSHVLGLVALVVYIIAQQRHVITIYATVSVENSLQISENFYFDLNDDWLRAMISKHVGREDEASKCTQAVFSISQSIADVFIVVKVSGLFLSSQPISS